MKPVKRKRMRQLKIPFKKSEMTAVKTHNKKRGPAVSMDELIKGFIAFALPTFQEATSLSSLTKCKEEIAEVESHLLGYHYSDENFTRSKLLEEYADCLMCIVDSAARYGFTAEEINDGFMRKLLINKNRTWQLNPDNTYSHVHVKCKK